MPKVLLSGLTLLALTLSLLGTAATRSSALPAMRPQTSQQILYRHHRHHHSRPHPGIVVHL